MQSWDYIPTSHFRKATTTKLSVNAYQNKRVPLLFVTWPNAKVIKATNPKLALMLGTHPYRQHDL